MVVTGIPSFAAIFFEEILPLGVSIIFKSFLSSSDKVTFLAMLVLARSY